MTTAIATAVPLESRRAWLGWILPGSVALHVVAIAVLPTAGGAPVRQAPLVLEMVDPPPADPPPADPSPPEEAAPEPAPTSAQAVARATAAPLRTTVPSGPPREIGPGTDSPVDFTGAVMSNDGPGMQLGSGAPAARGAGPGVVAPPSRPRATESRLVAAKDLSRLPRPPGLDRALEQHYPVEARRSGISGKAVLRVRILPDGRVGVVERVEESGLGFARACEQALRSARWEPPIDREGAPVATEITYTCRFEIRG